MLDARDALVLLCLRGTSASLDAHAEALVAMEPVFESVASNPRFRDSYGMQRLAHLFVVAGEVQAVEMQYILGDILGHLASINDDCRRRLVRVLEDKAVVDRLMSALNLRHAQGSSWWAWGRKASSSSSSAAAVAPAAPAAPTPAAADSASASAAAGGASGASGASGAGAGAGPSAKEGSDAITASGAGAAAGAGGPTTTGSSASHAGSGEPVKLGRSASEASGTSASSEVGGSGSTSSSAPRGRTASRTSPSMERRGRTRSPRGEEMAAGGGAMAGDSDGGIGVFIEWFNAPAQASRREALWQRLQQLMVSVKRGSEKSARSMARRRSKALKSRLDKLHKVAVVRQGLVAEQHEACVQLLARCETEERRRSHAGPMARRQRVADGRRAWERLRSSQGITVPAASARPATARGGGSARRLGGGAVGGGGGSGPWLSAASTPSGGDGSRGGVGSERLSDDAAGGDGGSAMSRRRATTAGFASQLVHHSSDDHGSFVGDQDVAAPLPAASEMVLSKRRRPRGYSEGSAYSMLSGLGGLGGDGATRRACPHCSFLFTDAWEHACHVLLDHSSTRNPNGSTSATTPT